MIVRSLFLLPFSPKKSIINVTFGILKVTSDTVDFAQYHGVEKDNFSERNSSKAKMEQKLKMCFDEFVPYRSQLPLAVMASDRIMSDINRGL